MDLSSLGNINNYTVVVNTQNVRLRQTGGQINNLSISCAAGTNLFIDGLDIYNTQTKSAIIFQGAGNTLNLIGTNKLEMNVASSNDPPLIQVQQGVSLTIDNAAGHSGELSAVITSGTFQGSVIGAGTGVDCGDITISGGKVRAVASASYGGTFSCVLGGSKGNLTISRGEVTAILNASGSSSNR